MLVLNHAVQKTSSFSLEMSARKSPATKREKRRASTTKNRQRLVASNSKATKIPSQERKPPASIGEAIQYAKTADDLLNAASKLWLPTDADLPPHLRTQQVHHEKRQRWSSQLLYKLGFLNNNNSNNIDWKDDDRLVRAVLAAALPFQDDASDDRPNKEGRYLREALWGMHALAGRSQVTNVHPDICRGIEIMIQRVEGMAHDVSLPEAAEIRWAARGLLTRIGLQQILGTQETDSTDTQTLLAKMLPNLEQRLSSLPFDIVPLGVQWDDDMTTSTLCDAIPFQFDTIVTRSGSSVTERRGTAWVAEEGIGALAYSGKLMPPRPIPPLVGETMRLVEATIGITTGPFFDCALCNHYPDGEAACKFHTDPEHGTVWERLTCVVSTGDERRFAFRPIPGRSTWSEWDDVEGNNTEETMPAVIHLFPGDIVKMWGTCNDDFHHAVYTGEGENANGDGRVSLVFKRAISRGGGRRGHGLQGEGRRSCRKSRAEQH